VALRFRGLVDTHALIIPGSSATSRVSFYRHHWGCDPLFLGTGGEKQCGARCRGNDARHISEWINNGKYCRRKCSQAIRVRFRNSPSFESICARFSVVTSRETRVVFTRDVARTRVFTPGQQSEEKKTVCTRAREREREIKNEV
jgi:hypothetical protein